MWGEGQEKRKAETGVCWRLVGGTGSEAVGGAVRGEEGVARSINSESASQPARCPLPVATLKSNAAQLGPQTKRMGVGAQHAEAAAAWGRWGR